MKKQCKIVLLEMEDRLREGLYTEGHMVFGTELVLIFPILRFPQLCYKYIRCDLPLTIISCPGTCAYKTSRLRIQRFRAIQRNIPLSTRARLTSCLCSTLFSSCSKPQRGLYIPLTFSVQTCQIHLGPKSALVTYNAYKVPEKEPNLFVTSQLSS